jgi:hypothetical protein
VVVPHPLMDADSKPTAAIIHIVRIIVTTPLLQIRPSASAEGWLEERAILPLIFYFTLA